VKRLFLHIGMMKTGTTYLQNVWRANHDALADQGIWFPSGPDAPTQRFAVWDLVGRRPRGATDARVAGQWAALTADVADHAHETVLLSEEYLAARSLRLARRAVAGFPQHEVHVVVTARDLGRQLVSAWQESVKSGQTLSWPEFIARVRDRDAAHRDPARGFWLNQDLPTIVGTWTESVGAVRVHVVTVPPAGGPPTLLLDRLGGLVGFDPAQLTSPPRQANESLGAPATEVIRRLNEELDGRLNQRQYDFIVKRTLQTRLPRSDDGPLVLPAEHQDWATEEARRMIDFLRRGAYHVVGDLDDLLPATPDRGRAPTDVSDRELVESSLRALATLTDSYANLWWRNKRQQERAKTASFPARAPSELRGAGYRVTRRAAELADRNRVAGAAMSIYLRVRRRGSRKGSS
jgi:hypothetical protein